MTYTHRRTEPSVSLPLLIPVSWLARLDAQAAERGTSRSELVRRAIWEHCLAAAEAPTNAAQEGSHGD